MKPLGIQAIKVGEKNRMEVTTGAAGTSFIFTLTRPLTEGENIHVKCHAYEDKYKLNKTIGIFPLSMQPQEENRWIIYRDPPSCETDPVLITFPEDLAGADLYLMFTLQRGWDPNALNAYVNVDLLSKNMTVEALSGKGKPKILSAYWSDSKAINYGEYPTQYESILKPDEQFPLLRKNPVVKNETIYLHIHTQGMYGKLVECVSDRGISHVVEMRNNILSVEYTFSDDTVNEITVSCRQATAQSFEKTATIPYNPRGKAALNAGTLQVYAHIEALRKRDYVGNTCCRVDFRPDRNYNGSFGFSWFRIGDMHDFGGYPIVPYDNSYTKLSYKTNLPCLDHPFCETDYPGNGVMGKHYQTKDGTDCIVTDPNLSGTGSGVTYAKKGKRDNFIADATMAADHKTDYVKISLKMEYNDILKEYRAPVMTIKKDETVELQLFLYLEESPKAILFAFDNPNVEAGGFISFSIKKTPIIDPSGSIFVPNTFYKIRLTCHKQFDREVQLRAYAIPVIETDRSKIMAHKENGQLIIDTEPGLPLISRELCGMLRILPNDDAHWRKIKVKFFSVITQVGEKEKKGILENSKDEEEYIKKFLSQAYVKPDIDYLEMDLTDDEAKKLYADCCTKGKNKQIDHQNKRDKLIDLLKERTPMVNRGTSDYLIFFLPERGKGAAGFHSYTDNITVCYGNNRITTPVHELLHALGLRHTFYGNYNTTGKYTYEVGKTDNLMDYTYWKYCKSLFEWQWHAINTKLNK